MGMMSAQTYGGLNDYAMTFTMNDDTDRGFLWRDDADSSSDGAMSLTTAGLLTVKQDVRTPRVYDQNNTSYYLDPASTSLLTDIEVTTEIRAPVFYDRNNSSFYLDPAGTSNLELLQLENDLSFTYEGIVPWIRIDHAQAVLCLDCDSDNSVSTQLPEQFRAIVNGNDSGSGIHMVLQQAEGTSNDGLFLRGSVFDNYSFDLAESFFASESVEPGDVVRIAPSRSDAVIKTDRAYDAATIGVVSTRPGFVLGGPSFSEDDLRETWGDRVADDFASEKSRLVGGVFDLYPGYRARLDELSVRPETARMPTPGLEGSRPARGTLQAEINSLQSDIEWQSIQLFFQEQMAYVALAGRVPVKVDTSFGPIAAGDPLTSSPIPGVAMKATEAGATIGTALESFTSGQGLILVLIHRGHYAPPATLAATQQVQQELAERIDTRTPDPVSGLQSMPGDLQVALDRDADDQARFSVFRDGGGGMKDEVFRVDEQGNVYAGGSFRPSAMDVGEYHPVMEAVEPGDVLVANREIPGVLALGRLDADPAVVGIVSAEPGVLLGSGLERLAAAVPDLAAQLEEARTLGDRAEETRLWRELQQKFEATHAPIALTGTVLCKVDAGYGSIEVGNLLTTSPTPGHAMRATETVPGTIVAKALEPLDYGTGLIKVLVMLR
jgi:hypothetical protein